MPLFGIGKKPPAARRRRRQRNPWLRSVMKEESSKALIKDMQAENPVIQAAIVQGMTGIEVKPESIKVQTPQEKFETAVTNEMLKDLGADQEFLQDAKERMLEKLSYGDGKGGRGRYGYLPYGRRPEDEEFGPYSPYPTGYDANDPEMMVDRVERLKERLGAKSGGLDSIMNSDVLKEIVKIMLPLMLGKGAQQIAAGPQLVSVEVDGRLVEMTRDGYEVFKRQRRLLAAGHGPAPIAPGPPPANNGTPPAPAAPASVAPAAAPAAGEKAKAEEPEPAPASADEGPIMIENEEFRQQVLTLVKGLIDDTDKRSPQEFAQLLVDQADENDTNAIVAVNFLATITYEQGMGYLRRLKHYEDFLPYIEKIEAREEYMRAFIDHVKDLTEEK